MGFLGGIRNLIGTFETKIQDSIYKSTGGDEEATKVAMSLLKGMILDEFVSDKNIDDVVEQWVKKQQETQKETAKQETVQQEHKCESCAKPVVEKIEQPKTQMPKFDYTPVEGRITWMIDEPIANLALPKKQENIRALILHMGNYDSTLQMYDDMSKVTSLSEFSSLGGEVDDVCAKKDMSEEEKQIRDNVKLDALSLAIDNIIDKATQQKNTLLKNTNLPETLKNDLLPLYERLASANSKEEQTQVQAEIEIHINDFLSEKQPLNGELNVLYKNLANARSDQERAKIQADIEKFEQTNPSYERAQLQKVNTEITSAIIDLNNAHSLKSMLQDRDAIQDENLKTELNDNILGTLNSCVLEHEMYERKIQRLSEVKPVERIKKTDYFKELYGGIKEVKSFSEFQSLETKLDMSASKIMSQKDKQLQEEAKIAALTVSVDSIIEHSSKAMNQLFDKADYPKALMFDLAPLYDNLSKAQTAEQQAEIQAKIAQLIHESADNYEESVKFQKINTEITSACVNFANAQELKSMLNTRNSIQNESLRKALNDDILSALNSFAMENQAADRKISRLSQEQYILSLGDNKEKVKDTIDLFKQMEEVTSFSDLSYLMSKEVLSSSEKMSEEQKQLKEEAKIGCLDFAVQNVYLDGIKAKEKLMQKADFPETLKKELYPLYDQLAQAKSEQEQNSVQAKLAQVMQAAKKNGLYSEKVKRLDYELKTACLKISNADNIQSMLNERKNIFDETEKSKLNQEIFQAVNSSRQIEDSHKRAILHINDSLGYERQNTIGALLGELEHVKYTETDESKILKKEQMLKDKILDYCISEGILYEPSVQTMLKYAEIGAKDGMSFSEISKHSHERYKKVDLQDFEKQMQVISSLDGLEEKLIETVEKMQKEYQTTGTTDFDLMQRMMALFGSKYFEESEEE